uniref:Uncharacterized protein n=1 Tax=Ralstonia solanacearum TaxID=305 RepID=A0A0S4U1Z6_RALSL|nr:protein of unknown function [Ralstonia solanacearum]
MARGLGDVYKRQIQHAGDLTLSTPGAVTNSGQIIAGNDLAVSGGGISNAAGATLHADHDLSVTGATTNRGTVEALNDVKICLLYTSPSPRDKRQSRMPSSA